MDDVLIIKQWWLGVSAAWRDPAFIKYDMLVMRCLVSAKIKRVVTVVVVVVVTITGPERLDSVVGMVWMDNRRRLIGCVGTVCAEVIVMSGVMTIHMGLCPLVNLITANTCSQPMWRQASLLRMLCIPSRGSSRSSTHCASGPTTCATEAIRSKPVENLAIQTELVPKDGS